MSWLFLVVCEMKFLNFIYTDMEVRFLLNVSLFYPYILYLVALSPLCISHSLCHKTIVNVILHYIYPACACVSRGYVIRAGESYFSNRLTFQTFAVGLLID